VPKRFAAVIGMRPFPRPEVDEEIVAVHARASFSIASTTGCGV